MHKYQPRIHIVKKKDNTSIQSLEAEEFRTFIFPESVFIGVTAYQNQLVSYPSICVNLNHLIWQSNVKVKQKSTETEKIFVNGHTM